MVTVKNARPGKRPGPEVKVGQVWKDRDHRRQGEAERRLLITGVEPKGDGPGYALARVIRDGEPTSDQSLISTRTQRIRLDRFRPISTGYDLVVDVGLHSEA